MQTDHPTVELYFGFAFTYCKLRVYKKNEVFARRVLEMSGAELADASESESWQEIDPRVMLDLVSQALPKILAKVLPQPKNVANDVAAALGIEP